MPEEKTTIDELVEITKSGFKTMDECFDAIDKRFDSMDARVGLEPFPEIKIV